MTCQAPVKYVWPLFRDHRQRAPSTCERSWQMTPNTSRTNHLYYVKNEILDLWQCLSSSLKCRPKASLRLKVLAGPKRLRMHTMMRNIRTGWAWNSPEEDIIGPHIWEKVHTISGESGFLRLHSFDAVVVQNGLTSRVSDPNMDQGCRSAGGPARCLQNAKKVFLEIKAGTAQSVANFLSVWR